MPEPLTREALEAMAIEIRESKPIGRQYGTDEMVGFAFAAITRFCEGLPYSRADFNKHCQPVQGVTKDDITAELERLT